MSSWEPYDLVGLAGSFILGVSVLPQIYYAHTRRSTKDISFLWQVSDQQKNARPFQELIAQTTKQCVVCRWHWSASLSIFLLSTWGLYSSKDYVHSCLAALAEP